MADQETDVHINPIKVLHLLEEVLPDNAILVADGGDFVGTAAYILRYEHSQCCFRHVLGTDTYILR